ncbi:taurine catabolism dioxygenase TauD/TfdA [Mycobacteroides abscessus subsp. bolletii]|uniref:TauD/TfdA dioxygenase family protein n=1 Tax=Mycobacteroides abscessus TaxID=36809 RepID=UPI000928FD17|nr:TauD/TfdA family dioxygenase [Mycobacteroides abscessus]SIK04510.1 taurine catabolism dioxygenase TauD/TfdA [Mycobacteroides abscessus subsp. bolletii]
MLDLRKLSPNTGIEIFGVDVDDGIDDDTFKIIYEAWIASTVLLIRNQQLDPIQQINFSRRFGEVFGYTRSQFNHPDHPEILLLSNLSKEGKPVGSAYSGRVWHSDGAYLNMPPAASMLHSIEVPDQGGDTLFANMNAAYEALPERVKHRIDELRIIISRIQSRPYNYPDRPDPTPQELREWADVAHPMVWTHPETGRKALYVGGNVPWRVEGMKESESAPLVTYLQEFCTQPCFVYRHRWLPGDILLWDNRSAMHRATYYDDTNSRRLLHRTTISTTQGCAG